MANARVVVGHRQLSRTVTMEVDRDLLTRALSGYNHAATDRLIIMLKDRYKQVHGRGVGYLPRDGLLVEETTESAQRPQGCGCDCTGCDDQGYHCHREDKDCYL